MKKLKIKNDELFELEISNSENKLLYKGYLKDVSIGIDTNTGKKTICFDERVRHREFMDGGIVSSNTNNINVIDYFDCLFSGTVRPLKEVDEIKALSLITIYTYEVLYLQYERLKSIKLLIKAIENSMKHGCGLEQAVDNIIEVRKIK